MQKLNYVPNLLARSFRAGADAAVGLAVPDIADPFFAEIAGSIEVELVGRGKAVVVTSLAGGRRAGAPCPGGTAATSDQRADRGLRERGPVLPGTLAGADADGVRGPGPEGRPRRLRDRGRPGRRPPGGHASGPPRSPAGGFPRRLHPGDDHWTPAEGLPVGRGRATGWTTVPTSSAFRPSRPTKPPRSWSSGWSRRTLPRPCSPRTFSARWRSSWPCRVRDVPMSPWSDSATFPWPRLSIPPSRSWTRIRPGLGRIAVERLLQRIENPHARLHRRTVLPVHLIPRGSGELPPRPE